MGWKLRKLLDLVQCASVVCALLLLGLTPDTGAAGADGWIIAVVAEEPHSQGHQKHGLVGGEAPVSSHCHPGLDCSLAAVVVAGPELAARTENVTRQPGFRDLALSGGTPSFDPPPPRRVS